MNLNPFDEYMIIWCDTGRGLISTYQTLDGEYCRFLLNEIPSDAVYVASDYEMFGILRRKDGTKVYATFNNTINYLGWEDAKISTI